jgi:hypothetical protein
MKSCQEKAFHTPAQMMVRGCSIAGISAGYYMKIIHFLEIYKENGFEQRTKSV